MVSTNTKLIFAILISTITVAASADYEAYTQAGLSSYDVAHHTDNVDFDTQDHSGNGLSIGAGIKNRYGRHLVGAGIDISRVENHRLTGFRAIDYQFEWRERVRTGAFIGAASWNTGLPQNGYYLGLSASRLHIWKHIDLTAEYRLSSGLARDRSLASDPIADEDKVARPDIFADINSIAVMLSWRL